MEIANMVIQAAVGFSLGMLSGYLAVTSYRIWRRTNTQTLTKKDDND